MKFATIVLLGILLLGSTASLNAQAAGTSQIVAAYINEKFDPPLVPAGQGFDGVCLVYYTLIGDLDLKSLFALDANKEPVVDKEHAYFIWVSDYKAQPLSSNEEFSFFMITEGTATIYYTSHPESRDWRNRSTWGDPVARFVRKAGMFQSRDGGYSGTFANTAELVSSTPLQLVTSQPPQLFTATIKMFDFKDVIPQGMTCFETLAGDYEAGSCVAIRK